MDIETKRGNPLLRAKRDIKAGESIFIMTKGTVLMETDDFEIIKYERHYFTFGQNHTHAFNGRTFDKDCIVEIEAEDYDKARKKMFSAFGDKWAQQYRDVPDISFYPRGIFKI